MESLARTLVASRAPARAPTSRLSRRAFPAPPVLPAPGGPRRRSGRAIRSAAFSKRFQTRAHAQWSGSTARTPDRRRPSRPRRHPSPAREQPCGARMWTTTRTGSPRRGSASARRRGGWRARPTTSLRVSAAGGGGGLAPGRGHAGLPKRECLAGCACPAQRAPWPPAAPAPAASAPRRGPGLRRGAPPPTAVSPTRAPPKTQPPLPRAAASTAALACSPKSS